MLGRYSLLDPEMQATLSGIAPSPFRMSAEADPALMGQTSEFMYRLAYPEDRVQPPQVDISVPPPEEYDVLDYFGAVLKAPFRLLGEAKHGLESAIGHPYADRRAMQDSYIETRKRLLKQGLKPHTYAALFPEDYARDVQALSGAQYSDSEQATGRNTEGAPLPETKKPWLVSWLMGDKQREQAKVQAAFKAYEDNLAVQLENQKYLTEQQNTLKTNREAFAANELGRLRGNQANEVAPNARAWRATEGAKQAEHYAGAAENYAQGRQADATAYAQGARGDQIYAITPSIIERNETASGVNRSRSGLLDAQTGQTNALTEPRVSATRAQAEERLSRARFNDSRANEVKTGGTETKLAQADNKRREIYANTLRNLINAGVDQEEAKREAALAAGVELKEHDPWGPFGDYTYPDFANFDPFNLRERMSGGGNVPSTSSETIPGQAPGSVNGDVEAVLRQYSFTPSMSDQQKVMIAHQLDAAVKRGEVPEGVAAQALEAMGFQRAR